MPWSGGILRLGGAEPCHRPRRGRPCPPETVERVRALWEETLRHPADIAGSVGLHPFTIAGWARNAGWVRPPFAPGFLRVERVRDTSRRQRRTAPARALAAAERLLAELEGDDTVDLVGLAGALSLLRSSRELRDENLAERRASPGGAAVLTNGASEDCPTAPSPARP